MTGSGSLVASDESRRPAWAAYSAAWTPSREQKFWDAKVTRLLEEVGHLLPCPPQELAKALDQKAWPKPMVTNTLAHGEGRWLYFRGGLWHAERLRR